MDNLLKRITVNHLAAHGNPVIRDSRYTVEAMSEYLAGGDTVEDVLKEFSNLEKDNILACLAYASAALRMKDIEVPTV